MDAHLFEVTIKWTKERKGVVCSPDVAFNGAEHGCFEVATPPPFAKGMVGFWSPEHLLTAAVSSCLMTTFLAIAENSNLLFSGFSCNAKGKLEHVDGKYLMTEVYLEPEVIIEQEADRERALRVLQKSELACLISNSIKSRVIMNPIVHVQGNL